MKCNRWVGRWVHDGRTATNYHVCHACEGVGVQAGHRHKRVSSKTLTQRQTKATTSNRSTPLALCRAVSLISATDEEATSVPRRAHTAPHRIA